MLEDEIIYNRNNIVMMDDAISYAYEITPIPVLNEAQDVLEATSEQQKQFFSKMNMPLHIVSMPKQVNIEKLSAYYDSESEHIFEGLEKQQKLLQETMLAFAKNASNTYHTYCFVTENVPEFQKINPVAERLKNLDFLPSSLTKKEAKKTLKNAEVTEKFIYNIFEQTLGGANRMTPSEIEETLESMRVFRPRMDFVASSFYETPQADHIKYTADVMRGEEAETISWYEQFFMLEDFGMYDREASNHLTQIQQSGFPITLYYKIYFRQPEKEHKELLAKKETIKKDAKKFRAAYKRSSGEYQKALLKAQQGIDGFELTDESSSRFQIMFRLHAESEEKLQKYREHVVRIFNKSRITVNYMVGRQEIMREQVMPFINKIKKHQFTDIQYLSHFNILGGSDLGEEVGHVLFKNVKTREYVALNLKKLMSGKAKSKSAITVVYGGSGSGKSFLVYVMAMQLLGSSGYPILKINPKDDEKNIGIHQQWIHPYYQNIVLGADATHTGALDPCFLYKNDINQIKSTIKNDIKRILSTSNYQNINAHAIDKAIDFILSKGKKLNMKRIQHVLSSKEETKYLANCIGELENTRLGRLMVGSDETNFIFDFSKPFTVLTFDRFPIIANFDKDNLEHVIANILLEKATELVQNFSNYWKRPGLLIVDEYYIWKQYPQGEATVEMMGRIVRSKLKHMIVSTQNVTDTIKKSQNASNDVDSLGNNTAMVFIGLLESNQEIIEAKNRYNLSSSLVRHLEKKLERSKMKNAKEIHDFIMIDYDKKRGIVEAIVPTDEMFLDYDNTFTEEKAYEQAIQEQEVTHETYHEKDESLDNFGFHIDGDF